MHADHVPSAPPGSAQNPPMTHVSIIAASAFVPLYCWHAIVRTVGEAGADLADRLAVHGRGAIEPSAPGILQTTARCKP